MPTEKMRERHTQRETVDQMSMGREIEKRKERERGGGRGGRIKGQRGDEK